MTKRKSQKNRLRYGAKLSEHKTNRLLYSFVNDHAASYAAQRCRVDLATVQDYYFYFRRMAASHAGDHPELFGGASLLISLGMCRTTAQYIDKYLDSYSFPKRFHYTYLDMITWPLLKAYAPMKFNIHECRFFREITCAIVVPRFSFTNEQAINLLRNYDIAEKVWEIFMKEGHKQIFTNEAWDIILSNRHYTEQEQYESILQAERDLRWILLKYNGQSAMKRGREKINQYFRDIRPKQWMQTQLEIDLMNLNTQGKLLIHD